MTQISKKSLKIFLSSSLYMKEERDAIAELIKNKNKEDREKFYNFQDELFNREIKLFRCEDADVPSEREIFGYIDRCDIFLFLYHEKVGHYALGEFKRAFDRATIKSKPKMLIFGRYTWNELASVVPRKLLVTRMKFEDEYEEKFAPGQHLDSYRMVSQLTDKLENIIDRIYNPTKTF